MLYWLNYCCVNFHNCEFIKKTDNDGGSTGFCTNKGTEETRNKSLRFIEACSKYRHGSLWGIFVFLNRTNTIVIYFAHPIHCLLPKPTNQPTCPANNAYFFLCFCFTRLNCMYRYTKLSNKTRYFNWYIDEMRDSYVYKFVVVWADTFVMTYSNCNRLWYHLQQKKNI